MSHPLRLFLLLCWSLALPWSALLAAESPPPPRPVVQPPRVAVAIDCSRSSSNEAYLDRLRQLVDGVLAKLPTIGVHAFAQSIEAIEPGAFGARVAGSRYSDYYRVFEQVVRPARTAERTVVIIAGDGHIEAVTPDIAARPYLGWTGEPDPTREAVNAAVERRLKTDFMTDVQDPQTDWIWYDSDSAGDDQAASLVAWLDSQRPEAVVLKDRTPSLRAWIDTLVAFAVLDDTAFLRGDELARSGAGTILLTIPEGAETVDCYVHGEQADYRVSVLRAGTQLDGQAIEILDDQGVARHYRLRGTAAGGVYEFRFEGAETRYELVAALDRELRHRMQAPRAAGYLALFAGDTLDLKHLFQRGDGELIGDELRADLMADLQLAIDGQDHVGTEPIVLKAGTMRISARFPNYPWVDTEPFELTVDEAAALRLVGGFTRAQIYAGQAFTLEFQRQGGKRMLPEIPLALSNDDGATLALTVQPIAGVADHYRIEWPTSDVDIALWSLPETLRLNGETATIEIAADHFAQLAIVWDWRVLALIIGIVLLLLLALFLWWFLTRPKWRQEILVEQREMLPLAGTPGPRARNTSYGCAALQQTVLFEKTRQGLVIKRCAAACPLWINGRAIPEDELASALRSGNDLEVQTADGRLHLRYFEEPVGYQSWTAEQAQIDLDQDFDSPHFIIED